MDFRILGPLEVRADDGQVLTVGSQKQRALLAMLLLHANEVVSSDRLVEAVWDDQPPPTALKALQVYVSHLRKVLGKNRLQRKPPGYLLRVDAGELDVDRCRDLSAAGKPVEALALWRGPALADFTFSTFAQAEIARLEELRLTCVEDRIELKLGEGGHAGLVGELESLVVDHPLRERFRAQLMLALYRSGRQAESLEAYQTTRRTLLEELGIEPSRELRDLHQAVLAQSAALDLAPQTFSEVESPRSVLVGREAELAELFRGLDGVFAGRGRFFLLVGEPGIGKSRLADEVIARARSRGALVLTGRCWEAGGAPAYWPWVQSLRGCIHETPGLVVRANIGSGAADLAQLLPELREMLPEIEALPELEPESARFRLFEAVTRFLISVAKARPVVLVLDDLHAADEPSLLLLRFLARAIGQSRLLVVGACRDVDPTPTDALAATLTELRREPTTQMLPLSGLSEPDVARFIQLVSGRLPSEQLAGVIHDDTEGNPLFVAEIVRLLAAEGELDRADAPDLVVPQTVRDVIARRLRHLSDDCNRVLASASVLGREFGLAPLARVAGIGEEQLLDILDEAMKARVVSDLPGSRGYLRFAHVLIRDTLYENLTTARRVRLHRLVVDALEPEADFAQLAHHAIAGSDFERALAYARDAGDRALSILAYEDAARSYELAIESLEIARPGDDEHRCDLLISLGEAETRAGNSRAAKTAFLQAAEIARRLQLGKPLARAAAGYGGGHVWARAGPDTKLIPLLEEALRNLPADEIGLQVRLLARLAGALRDEASSARRDRISREAVELARADGNPAALSYALDGRVTAIANPRTLAECLTLAEELCQIAEQLGDNERMVYGRQCRLIVHGMLGNIAEAEREIQAMSRIAEQLQQPEHLFQVKASQSMLALAAGKLGEAEQLIPDFYALGERAQPAMALPISVLQQYSLFEYRHQLHRIEEPVRELVDQYPARPVFQCLLAHLSALIGRYDAASDALHELTADNLSSLPFDIEWLFAVCLLSETCAVLEDVETAETLYAHLLPWSALNAVDHPEGIRGSVSRYLGQLAHTRQDWDTAAKHFEDAIRMNAEMGVLPWLAYTKLDYGRTLIRRHSSTDKTKAQNLEEDALTTLRQLGVNPAVHPKEGRSPRRS